MNKINIKRNFSYSDGFILEKDFPQLYTGLSLDSPKLTEILNSVNTNDLIINSDNDITIKNQEQNETKLVIIKKIIINNFPNFYNKLISFMFHLLLIACFEFIFFNYYVLQYENQALSSLMNQLTNPIINTCDGLNSNTKIIIDDFINLFFNKTELNNLANISYNKRIDFNHKLYILSIYYFSGIFIFIFGLIIINRWLKVKLNYKSIIFDNIVLILILGAYEYIFFKNIVFNYITITPDELKLNVINNILMNC